jgi:hypothetical protein
MRIGDDLSKTYFDCSGENLEIVFPDQQKKKLIYPTGNAYKDFSDLSKFIEFLKIDANWMSATCALQLQEVAVTIVAKKKGIQLDKKNVTEIAKNSQSSGTCFR